jgi:hypothetical protein
MSMKHTILTLGVAFIMTLSASAIAESATVLFGGKTIAVEQTLASPTDLWVTPEDLTRINGFVLKPEGACLDEICIPVKQDSDSDQFVTRLGQKWFNVTALAQKLNQAYTHNAANQVWSFAPMQYGQSPLLNSAVAPDFELKDRSGNVVRLSDYRGKKVMIHTWASW